MVDLSNVDLEPIEIINYLGQMLQLREICQRIICQKIINSTAQTQGLVVTSEEVQLEMYHIRSEQTLENYVETSIWLANELISLNDWELGIRNRLLTQKLSKAMFSGEVEHFFSQHQADFDQILLYRITVPYERLSQELFYQIEEEEISFYEAAHLYNTDWTYKLHCGYHGIKYRRDLSPDIVETVFNAREGEVIGPIKSANEAYDLWLVEAQIPARLTPELHDNIVNQLFQEWLENELITYMNAES